MARPGTYVHLPTYEVIVLGNVNMELGVSYVSTSHKICIERNVEIRF